MTELIERAEVLKILFPQGVPLDGWDYCVSARAIYEAVMKCKVFEPGDRLANLKKIKEQGFSPKKIKYYRAPKERLPENGGRSYFYIRRFFVWR